MSELDKLFKNKLQNREFELKDSYWQQAEQMIAAQESGLNWKKGFWLLGALLLIALAGFVFWPAQPSEATNLAGNADEFGYQSTLTEEPAVDDKTTTRSTNSGSQHLKLL